ncbi:hypothetical protein GJ496_003040 [Pomphorhynchus laevis]|nr:hypothetical protein GJ496_003040 [Pomphorhynchus laevis]
MPNMNSRPGGWRPTFFHSRNHDHHEMFDDLFRNNVENCNTEAISIACSDGSLLQSASAAAVHSRLPPDRMTNDETMVFVDVVQEGQEKQKVFIQTRNRILQLWLDNPCIQLTLPFIINNFSEAWARNYRSLIVRIYQYLDRLSYINFGVYRRLLQPNSLRGGRVIIIGAGIAGLSAARQLKSFGLNVIILEARDRIGGRIATWRRNQYIADLGAMLLTGTGGNPCAILQRQIGMDLIPIKSECPLYDSAGRPVSQNLDDAVEREFNSLLDVCSFLSHSLSEKSKQNLSLGQTFEALYHLQERKALCMATTQLKMYCSENDTDKDIPYHVYMSPAERRLLDWHLANLEFANAGPLEHVSLCNWDQDDDFELQGSHMFVCSGFSSIPLALSEGLDVQLSTPIISINHTRSRDIQVISSDNTTYHCDACLVTVPLGVLKDDVIRFEPQLPDWKLQAIKRLGYGNMNKVVLCFEKSFWENSPQLFGHVSSSIRSRGEFFLFWAMYKQPTLIALSSGHAANIIEHVSDELIVAKCLAILKGIFGAANVQPLKDAVVTRWGMDQWSRGSYSYVAKESYGGSDYDLLAKSINSGVYFAGEHTNRNYPATVHGAMLSGFRAAREITDMLIGGLHDTNIIEI